MKVDRVEVAYGELRSTGYPSFSNRRYEVTLSAMLETGDVPATVHKLLSDEAKRTVKNQFGDRDVAGQTFMDLPF